MFETFLKIVQRHLNRQGMVIKSNFFLTVIDTSILTEACIAVYGLLLPSETYISFSVFEQHTNKRYYKQTNTPTNNKQTNF
jgi:hypothetical protein